MSKNKNKYKKKDLAKVLDKLYRCRDLEISNLWQRSVFLSVFLILCFSAYGYISIKILSINQIDNVFFKYNFASIILASISIIFSVIWILMAKASKAWYEVYETAIRNFEKKFLSILGMPKENIMGEMKLPNSKRNNRLFSTKGGAYSPSRINIAIGQISATIWFIIVFFHIILHLIYTFEFVDSLNCFKNIFVFIAPLFTLIIVLYILKSSFLKSTFLNEDSNQ